MTCSVVKFFLKKGKCQILLERNLPSHTGDRFSDTDMALMHIKSRAFVFSLVKRCRDVPRNECR